MKNILIILFKIIIQGGGNYSKMFSNKKKTAKKIQSNINITINRSIKLE